MEVIRGESKEKVNYGLRFFYDDNGGFEFPCDENGNLLDVVTDGARKNYKWCLENPGEFQIFNKVIKHTKTYREPNTGICDCCGETVTLVNEYMGACSCPKCGQLYNLFGQKLKSPETWSNGYDW